MTYEFLVASWFMGLGLVLLILLGASVYWRKR